MFLANENIFNFFFFINVREKYTPKIRQREKWGWRFVHLLSLDSEFRKSTSCPNWQIKWKVETVIFKEK